MKKPYKSKTIIGIVAVLAVYLFAQLNLEISENEIVQIIEGGAALFGGLLAIYGRIAADGGIGWE